MYKSQKGWYYRSNGRTTGVGPFATAEAAKSEAKGRAKVFRKPLHSFFFTVYYGTPCRLIAAKDVYIKDIGHVYFTRVR